MVKDVQDLIVFPEIYKRRELNVLYRKIPLKDAASRLLRKYFNAMANLYGIVPLRKAYEIISEQNPKLVTKEEFLAFAEVARHECEEYDLLGSDELYVDGRLKDPLEREIIDVTLIGENLEAYHALMEMQRGKPYYIPPKKLFLEYADPFFYEPSEHTSKFLQFLETQLQLNAAQVNEVFEDMLYGIRYRNADFPQVQHRVTEMGIRFKRDQDFRLFIKLFQSFHNNTRMQSNRGYTPEEMHSLLPPEECVPQAVSLGPNIRNALADGSLSAAELGLGILNAELPNEALRLNLLKELAQAAPQRANTGGPHKIGRNDPCPCGSGKKYKKCCGK